MIEHSVRLARAAGLAGAALLSGCALIGPPEPSVEVAQAPDAGWTAYEEANVANVTAFYNAAFNAKNFVRARFYLADSYIEHDPAVGDARSGLEASIASVREEAPFSRRSIEGAYADGDYVLLHVRARRADEDLGTARFEIYRLDENGKVAEHWSVAQAIPAPEETRNANGMFYDVSSAEPAPLPPDQEEENKRIATEFYDRALNRKDFAGAQRLMGDVYVQHNPAAVDGPEGLAQHVAMVRETYPENRGELQRAFVDGDRVFLHLHTKRAPDQAGMAVVDMFRVTDGKVVEHWDVIQPVPETAANGNGMF
jgi:predicted SnoaL-like aldol condensation-catalyzing enzyme